MTCEVMDRPRLPFQTDAMTTATLPSAPARAAEPAAPHPLALPVMLTGVFVVVLDFFIVNVALPSLQRDLGASDAMLQWVVAGYGLATAAGLVTGGRLGDLHGRRRMFMLGLLLFTLASIGCGAAPTAGWLVAARVLQGLAAAVMQPQVLAMLGVVFSGAARTRAFAAYGIAMGLAASSGQLIGGTLISLDLFGLGWRLCFLINLPIGVAALLAARRALPAPAQPGGSRLDLAGAALLSIAATALVLPLVQGRDLGWPAWAWWLLAGTVPCLLLFALQQRRLAARGGQPLVAPALIADRRLRAGLATALAFYIGNASLYFVLALFLQQGLHLPPFTSGLVFTAMAVGFFVASLAAPRLAARFGGAPIARGALLLAAAHLLQLLNVLLLDGGLRLACLVPLLFMQGLGLGVVMAPLSGAVLAGLPPQHAGVASGVLGTVQQVGNALGVALVGLVFYGTLAAGQAHAFAASLLFLAATAGAVAVLYRRVLCLDQKPAARPSRRESEAAT